MGVARTAGDWAFKAFTAGLGVATIYLTASFSFNVYRGLAWHNAQSVKMYYVWQPEMGRQGNGFVDVLLTIGLKIIKRRGINVDRGIKGKHKIEEEGTSDQGAQ